MNFKEKIEILVKSQLGKTIQLEVPPNSDLGDFAFPCFKFAKELKQSPVQIAKDFIIKLNKPSDFLEKITNNGPYVNFYLKKNVLAKFVLEKIKSHKFMYGSHPKKDEKIMVEFSQPNPFKGVHIGHLRNTVLGESLVRILKFYGQNVISANLYNDTGAHVAKCMWAWRKFYNFKDLTGDKGESLGSIYTEASKKIKVNEEYKKEANELNKQLDDGDPALTKQWLKGRQWSVDSFNKIYKELDVHFDKIDYDSDLNESAKMIVKELLVKGIAIVDEGATIVKLKEHKLPTALILKSDGTLLYLTKDLALAKKRFTENDIDKLVYVVAAPQKTHFQQLFKILELWGFAQSKNCFHLSYEMVKLKDGGKMSSREGNIILYSYLKNKLFNHSFEEVKKRHADWTQDQQKESALNMTMAAMKFSMLHQDNNKTIQFDLDHALDFEGETGPYLQYTHARINSILKKYNNAQLPNKINYDLFKEKVEHDLITQLAKFPDVVEDAAKNYRPPVLTYYLLELARSFNEFYHACPVLKAEPNLKEARLILIDSVRQVLANGLKLLAIPAPLQM